MANTNLIFKDLDHLDFLEINDAASKVVGGQELACTDENRQRIVSGLQATGFFTSEQLDALLNADLATFCADFDDYLEVTTGVRVFQTAASSNGEAA